jgi:hypothetical protein
MGVMRMLGMMNWLLSGRIVKALVHSNLSKLDAFALKKYS